MHFDAENALLFLAVLGIWARFEHRMTKVETVLEFLRKK